MSPTTSKILVIGTVSGQFSVFEKISKLHAKNNFSLAVLLGDLFEDPQTASDELEAAVESLLAGNPPVPLPTYFTLGKNHLPPPVLERLESHAGEVCDNLYFLGKRSTTKTSEGVRIVSLGGLLDTNVTAGLSQDKYLPFHTEGDAKSLSGVHETDLLITYPWPSSIQRLSQINLGNDSDQPIAENCIADLCSNIKPRYHFSTTENIFYEREPFFHVSPDGLPETDSITRFISLASYGNSAKQKWLYAFSIDSSKDKSTSAPAGATTSPFLASSKKRQHTGEQDRSFSRFGESTAERHGHHRPQKRSRHKDPPPGPQECFFCLSNPNLAAHLITSIGNDSYLTTAKGPLTTADTFPSLKFPGPILIIPLSHSPTISSITPADTRTSTYEEMTRYRKALQRMVAAQSRAQLGAITWEVSRAEGIHVHWQFLPVQVDTIRRGLVEAGFKVEAENEKYPTFTAKRIGDGSNEKADYFRVWIWVPGQPQRDPESPSSKDLENSPRDEGTEDGTEKELSLQLPTDTRFDLRFGRRVMAKLLGLETRLQWRDCEQEEDEEKRDAGSFKDAFKKYDFSLNES